MAVDRTTAAKTPGPFGSAAVFALTTIRGSRDDAARANQIGLSAEDRVVVFTVDLPPAEGPRDYAAALKDRGNRTLWTAGPFRPSSPDTLAVAVERTRLPDGVYTLEIERRSGNGRAALIGRYPFEVTAR
jgi:hypothetical protein